MIESRKVTIVVKRNPSFKARLGEGVEADEVIYRRNRIGGGLRGKDVLRGLSFEEEIKLLPSIAGISPKSDKWERTIKDYWSNISVDVPFFAEDDKKGLDLEVGFRYNSAEDAEKGNEEERIEIAKYAAERHVGKEYWMRFDKRLELGTPLNLEDFVLYRYCLVYSHVANRPEDKDLSPKIRFYMISSEEVKAEVKTQHEVSMRSMAEYLKLIPNRSGVQDVIDILKPELISAAQRRGKDLAIDDDIQKDIALHEFQMENPVRFIAVVTDKRLKDRAFIERAITYGMLRRLPHTDTIMYGDNTKIGDNVLEAIDFLNDDKNKTVRQELSARLKTIM